MFCLTRPIRVALLGLTLGATAANAQMPPQAVQAARLEQRSVSPSIPVVGSVTADRVAAVASEVEGLLTEFVAGTGAYVSTGDVVARLNSDVAELRLEEARGRLAELEAALAELEAGTRTEEVQRAEADLQEAEALYDLWSREQTRVNQLFERGAGSVKEKIETDMNFAAAAGRKARAAAERDLAKNGPRAEVILAAREAVAAQRAVVTRLERDVDRAAIRAPFTGFITDRLLEIGEWVEQGEAVFEIIHVDTVRVRLDVPESVVAFAKPGVDVTLELPALRDLRTAPITRRIPLGRDAARTFPIEIDLQNTEHEVLPGMFVRARVPSGPAAPRLMAPLDAIIPQGLSKQLYVIRGEMAMPVAVETGLQSDGYVEISANGVRAGDWVVVRANERLRGPSPVIPTNMQGQPLDADAAADDAPAAALRTEASGDGAQ